MPEPQAQDLELYHFGVKGMKWGVRRDKIKTAIKEEIKRPVSNDAKSAGSKRGKVRKHGTDTLSNKDLKDLVERMNLEQQYANLVEQKKSASVRSSGRRYVADILKDVGTDLLTEALKAGARKAAGAAAGRAASHFTSWEHPSGRQSSIGMIRKALT